MSAASAASAAALEASTGTTRVTLPMPVWLSTGLVAVSPVLMITGPFMPAAPG